VKPSKDNAAISFISIALTNGFKKIRATDVFIVRVCGIRSDRLLLSSDVGIQVGFIGWGSVNDLIYGFYY